MYGLNGELTSNNIYGTHTWTIISTMPEHTLNNSLCYKPVCGIFPLLFPFIIIHVWNIPFDLKISENSKSDSSSQLDEKEEDKELFFPGIHEYYKLLKVCDKITEDIWSSFWICQMTIVVQILT